MKVIIVGTGYVGLVTGACLAEVGTRVTCIDIDQEKIERLRQGILPIYEPGLEEIVERNIQNNRLTFSTDLSTAVVDADIVFIAVGTPSDEDGSADLKYVLKVAEEIGRSIQQYAVVVTKSTVPVGTSEKVRAVIQSELTKRAVDVPFDVASNPEFLKEGDAVKDFLKPDRIVIGIDNDTSKDILEALYEPFVLNGHQVLFMDITSAELTKYAANAMLATRISFMNDMALLCDKLGADINEVRRGMGTDPRIGDKFLNAGVGYGGSCFPKDIKALINTGKTSGHPMRILEAVEVVNDDQKCVLFNRINAFYNHDLEGKKIAIWGLSYKPNTDDMREATSLVIIGKLLQAGAQVAVFDPIAMDRAKEILGDTVTWCSNVYDTVEDADAIALVTEWNEFRLPDWDKIKSLVKGHVVFDGRNIYNKSNIKKMGFEYFGIGQ